MMNETLQILYHEKSHKKEANMQIMKKLVCSIENREKRNLQISIIIDVLSNIANMGEKRNRKRPLNLINMVFATHESIIIASKGIISKQGSKKYGK